METVRTGERMGEFSSENKGEVGGSGMMDDGTGYNDFLLFVEHHTFMSKLSGRLFTHDSFNF